MALKITSQSEFEKFLIIEYFKLGSIDKVIKEHRYSLPISFAGYHRVLNKYGVVKSAGPNSKISESLNILSLMATYKIPLERIYHKFAPRSVQVSTNTLHRILHYTRMGLTRRQGVALIVTRKWDDKSVLVGSDLSVNDPVLGQKGDISLPMGNSKLHEPVRVSIMRVLQQEVFTDEVLSKNFPVNFIPEHPKPIMFVNIADIRVSVYRIVLPAKTHNFSSYKLANLHFEKIGNLASLNLRAGVGNILNKYEANLNSIAPVEILDFDSDLNSLIFALAEEKQRKL